MKTNSKGSNFDTSGTTTIPFEHVYVTSTTDDASIINSKLEQGLHIVFSPGMYYINQPLVVPNHNQILLGLGLATLVASEGIDTVRRILLATSFETSI
jgi:hypothetical protein